MKVTCALLLLVLCQICRARQIENIHAEQREARVVIEGNTYAFSPPGTALGWEDAMLACNALDMALVSFETKAEFHAVRAYMETNGYNDVTWTSGRTYITGEWLWSSSGRVLTEKAWATGQPHLTTKCYPCIVFAQDSKGWSDVECELKQLAYICE